MLDTPQEHNSIFLSRSDTNEPLSSFSRFGFELEGVEWPSVEHYFQAMKFEDPAYREKIRAAQHPKQARRLGRTRFRKIRQDWSSLRRVVMTRAIYTRCRTHETIANALLASGDKHLVENSQYDYFWGCGRDRRGHNSYGQVLMDVRDKLREERPSATSPVSP
jgi:ribA/ribD-fused uncharacterized protein